MSIKRLSTGSISSTTPKNSKVWDQETFPGTFESIASATVYASSPSSIAFSNIPQNYTHLQIRFTSRSQRTSSYADELFMTINSTSLTKNHYLLATGSTVLSGAATAGWVGIQAASSATSGIFGTGIIDILDYTNTNKNKTIRSITGFDYSGGGEMYLLSNFINSTSAITSLNFTCSGSNTFVEYSNIALYGMRGA